MKYIIPLAALIFLAGCTTWGAKIAALDARVANLEEVAHLPHDNKPIKRGGQ